MESDRHEDHDDDKEYTELSKIKAMSAVSEVLISTGISSLLIFVHIFLLVIASDPFIFFVLFMGILIMVYAINSYSTNNEMHIFAPIYLWMIWIGQGFTYDILDIIDKLGSLSFYLHIVLSICICVPTVIMSRITNLSYIIHTGILLRIWFFIIMVIFIMPFENSNAFTGLILSMVRLLAMCIIFIIELVVLLLSNKYESINITWKDYRLLWILRLQYCLYANIWVFGVIFIVHITMLIGISCKMFGKHVMHNRLYTFLNSIIDMDDDGAQENGDSVRQRSLSRSDSEEYENETIDTSQKFTEKQTNINLNENNNEKEEEETEEYHDDKQSVKTNDMNGKYTYVLGYREEEEEEEVEEREERQELEEREEEDVDKNEYQYILKTKNVIPANQIR